MKKGAYRLLLLGRLRERGPKTSSDRRISFESIEGVLKHILYWMLTKNINMKVRNQAEEARNPEGSRAKRWPCGLLVCQSCLNFVLAWVDIDDVCLYFSKTGWAGKKIGTMHQTLLERFVALRHSDSCNEAFAQS